MNHTQNGYALDGTLYYEMSGEGETILLIHAGIANLQMWDTQWQALSQHYQVVRYDMRGFGRSADVDGDTPTHRQDVVALMAELGIEKAHLVGCSLGGEIALDVALEEPERVISLVLISATPGGFEMQGAPPPAVFAMIEAFQSGDMASAARAQNEMSVTGNRAPDAVNATVREQIFQMTRSAFERGNTMPTAGDALIPSAAERLEDIKVRTLLIVGEADHSELRRAAEAMANGIPHAYKQVMVVENAAHFPNIEQPAVVNNALLAFLATL